MNQCFDHTGICKENEAVKANLKQEITDRKKGDDDLWAGLNEMKRWIIGGMGSTIIAMGVFILNMVFPHKG